ncbi:carbohydrate-binding family 9-like protein [Chryseolinea sp. Jin1]|uniref:Carbohydrate-binding family 9-like protein n=2 Tax=Chryseolinea lacunae TaxID=2801331 RepID=A0ABS1KX61_9BACT|nr:carbohydrate-binding family 9-like protein [Chryseolinea lacunae]
MFITQVIYANKIVADSTTLVVKKTADFNVNGEGTAAAWATTSWVAVTVQESASGKSMTTQAKVLYSDRGLYFLFVCHDEKLTTTLTKDNVSLWKEDVVEVFLWPDQSMPIYFEYEISPMNFELPLLIPNFKGRAFGWSPWHYDGDRKTKRATSAQGGEKKSNATVKSWTAEFFIPFRLLGPLLPEQPKPGTKWRANLYRIDYDHGFTAYAWQHTSMVGGSNFHEYERFGTFLFE